MLQVKSIENHMDVNQLLQLRQALLNECHGRYRTLSANPILMRRVQLRKSDSFIFVGDRRIFMRVQTDRLKFINDAIRPHLDGDMELIEAQAILCGPGVGKNQPFHVDEPMYDRKGVVVQVPLQYTDSNNGQTEFKVNGHIHSPVTKLGEVLILDSSIIHRGVPNLGKGVRVILHLLYHERGVLPREWVGDFHYYHCRRLTSRVFEVSSFDPFFYASRETRTRVARQLKQMT